MVGFRYFVRERARVLGLAGYVRNGDDGETVEVVAEGDESDLLVLELALREGPRSARVESVDVRWSDDIQGYSSFDAR
jgi:acylphosphatase